MLFMNSWTRCVSLSLCIASAHPAYAALIAHDGFDSYPIGQLEAGPIRDAGTVPYGGTGWRDPFDVDDDEKDHVVVADSKTTPLGYRNGAVSIDGGDRALVLFGPRLSFGTLLKRDFPQPARLAPVYFSFLYVARITTEPRDSDAFFLGLDSAVPFEQARTTIGTDRLGSFRDGSYTFFAGVSSNGSDGTRSSNSDAIELHETYFLAGRISSFSGTNYDKVVLYVNPSTLTEPAQPDVQLGITPGSRNDNLSRLIINVPNLEPGDAFAIDELRIGSDYTSVVPEIGASLWLLCAGGFVISCRIRSY